MRRHLIIFTMLIILVHSNNKNKATSKFDRSYIECKNSRCQNRPNDESCILICVSENCYKEIYGNYLLEYGEINYELKNQFEQCFNLSNKNRS